MLELKSCWTFSKYIAPLPDLIQTLVSRRQVAVRVKGRRKWYLGDIVESTYISYFLLNSTKSTAIKGLDFTTHRPKEERSAEFADLSEADYQAKMAEQV